MSKLINLNDAVTLIKDNDVIALGGNVLHRAPHQFVYALIKKGIKNLEIVKTAGAHDVDILCLGGCARSVIAGFISYETEYGLCKNYRNAVESGEVKAYEHACYTVISGIRAAIQGVPFMPVKGMVGSDLLQKDYFKVIKDPFTGEEVVTVKVIKPEVAIIHVQEADIDGNARIIGPVYEDILFAKAAKKVIITTEKIISNDEIRQQSHLTSIPGFLVDAVVELPSGAKPGTCAGVYDIDHNVLKAFKTIETRDEMMDYLNKF